jgi:hypothetical protein
MLITFVILLIFWPLLQPSSITPSIISNNLVQFAAALTSNLFSALLWYTLLQKHEQSARLEPLIKAFPFLRDKTQEIYIILASLPSTVGHELTGIGEARSLGILLESFNKISFPSNNINITYSHLQHEAEIERIISNKNVILVGGPNYNKFTHYVFTTYSNILEYIFYDDLKSNGVSRRFSGSIISNRRIGGETIVYPLPLGVEQDMDVTSDCGLIVQIRGEKGNLITLLTGGMTTGVWVAAKIMTNPIFIERWLRYLQIKDDSEEAPFEMVFNCNVQKLSVSDDDIEILRAKRLTY